MTNTKHHRNYRPLHAAFKNYIFTAPRIELVKRESTYITSCKLYFTGKLYAFFYKYVSVSKINS